VPEPFLSHIGAICRFLTFLPSPSTIRIPLLGPSQTGSPSENGRGVTARDGCETR
jgi:hypothetical protein